MGVLYPVPPVLTSERTDDTTALTCDTDFERGDVLAIPRENATGDCTNASATKERQSISITLKYFILAVER